MTMFKKAYRKSWALGVWSGRLDSGLLDAWTLYDCTRGLWTIGAGKFFPFLVNLFLSYYWLM